MNFINIDKKYLVILFSLSSSAIFAFLTNIYLARFFGPYHYGIFSGALAMAVFIGGISLLGLDGFLLNIFGEKKSSSSQWVITSYKLIIISMSVCFLFMILWAYFGPHDTLTTKIIIFFSFLMIGHAVWDFVKSIYQINESYFKLSAYQLYPNLLRFFVILYLYLFNPLLNLIDIAIIFAFINISLIIFSIPILINFKSKRFKIFSQKNNKETDKKKKISINQLLNKSKNFMQGKIFFLVYFYLDIFLIKYLVGDLKLGYFNASFILILGSLLVTDAYLKSYSFKYFYYSKHNFSKFMRIFQKGNIFFLTTSISIVFILIFFSKNIVIIFFGSDYFESVNLLAILSLMIPFRFLYTNYAMALRTFNYALHDAQNLKKIVVIKIFISTYMILEFGVIGAAISTVVCEAILFFLCYHYAKKLVLKF